MICSVTKDEVWWRLEGAWDHGACLFTIAVTAVSFYLITSFNRFLQKAELSRVVSSYQTTTRPLIKLVKTLNKVYSLKQLLFLQRCLVENVGWEPRVDWSLLR